ncbi:conserved hypothetical protein [Ricinus communis]|uniref:RNase H type-1 domain-containing protein n=1 Tax=Ricinus communis TaxID=3988 RepID=B9SYC4_RICCO|nr:conserved hypothetical protein [Ricinus communis]
MSDSQGELVAVKNGCLRGPLILEVAEALSCKEALLWLKDNDCQVLAKDFEECIFSFIKRTANHVTHLLAKAANSTSALERKGPNPLSFLCNALLVDLQ